MINRREFFGAAAGAALFVSSIRNAAAGRRPKILLRNSWTSINIGDISHPFGMIMLIKKYMPDAEVKLWPSNTKNGVKELLKKTFPDVKLVSTPETIEKAKRDCHFLIHGSGADFVESQVVEWIKDTGKPWGVYGISYNPSEPNLIEFIEQSSFFFFRDSNSLDGALGDGANANKTALGFDSVFGVNALRNDDAARAFLSAHGLEEKKFLCCIPRMRWSPHWEMRSDVPVDPKKDLINKSLVKQDHEHLLQGIIEVVRRTDLKILVCNEDMSQVKLGKEQLIDQLPPDVAPRVVWKDSYWLPDEANSTFLMSAGMFSNDQHSPIMCIAGGIPAILFRSREQGRKGYMWADIGLADWLFDLDSKTDMRRAVPTILKMAKNPKDSAARAIAARDIVLANQEKCMGVLRENVVRAAI